MGNPEKGKEPKGKPVDHGLFEGQIAALKGASDALDRVDEARAAATEAARLAAFIDEGVTDVV